MTLYCLQVKTACNINELSHTPIESWQIIPDPISLHGQCVKVSSHGVYLHDVFICLLCMMCLFAWCLFVCFHTYICFAEVYIHTCCLFVCLFVCLFACCLFVFTLCFLLFLLFFLCSGLKERKAKLL